MKKRYWEYWNIHVLLAPSYAYLLWKCIWGKIHPYDLLKADYGIQGGGALFESKHARHSLFNQSRFLPSVLLASRATLHEKTKLLTSFGRKHTYPLVLKPNHGRIGFGVHILDSEERGLRALKNLREDYILEAFSVKPLEFGVFYVKRQGRSDVLSINSKEFPKIVGDGKSTVNELISQNPHLYRFASMLHKSNNDIPRDGEVVYVSRIGSHTQGVVFRDVSYLKTQKLVQSLHSAVGIPGFNYGRLDVRADSIRDFQRGEFDILEVNAIGSLSTNAFDPKYSLLHALQIFHKQFHMLWLIAKENQNAHMTLPSLRTYLHRLRKAERRLHNEQKQSIRFR